MARRKFATNLLAILLSFSLTGFATFAVALSKQEGDQLQRKIDEITKNGSASRVAPRKTPVTESELNSYLAFNLREKIPRGLTNPLVNMLGDGGLAGRVYVDLDEFKRQHQNAGFMDPLNYVSGRVPVTARGILSTSNGRGQFKLGSAEILGVPLPKPIVQELVTFFSRTPEHPGGFNLDSPFDLPVKIRELTINRGEAIVVQ
jgi:hypothetical protein